MVVDTALVAAPVAAAHCSMVHATQDMPADHSHGREAADVTAAGTDQGVLRHMEVVAVVHRRWGMAVSMEVLALVGNTLEVLALVGNTLALNHSQVHRRRRAEHEEHVVVVMDSADPMEQRRSSAWLSGWKLRS